MKTLKHSLLRMLKWNKAFIEAKDPLKGILLIKDKYSGLNNLTYAETKKTVLNTETGQVVRQFILSLNALKRLKPKELIPIMIDIITRPDKYIHTSELSMRSFILQQALPYIKVCHFPFFCPLTLFLLFL
jgi:hypothetical protein